MCFPLFSDVTFFFLLPGSEHEVGREFFICEDAAFVTPVCPRLVFGSAHLALNTAYSLSPQRRLSSASIKFLWLRQIHDPTAISPALDNALSTLLSCCSQHFIPLYIFRWSRSVTTTVNKPQRRQAFACRLF